jgi:Flp pilus assembly pilin Flp
MIDQTAPPVARALTLHGDEEGAQAVEYAMIGGLGAGLISRLWTVISRTNLIERVVESLVSALLKVITGWF